MNIFQEFILTKMILPLSSIAQDIMKIGLDGIENRIRVYFCNNKASWDQIL